VLALDGIHDTPRSPDLNPPEQPLFLLQFEV